jgi:4-hydroxy-tetrahydrodipicolinate reductase
LKILLSGYGNMGKEVEKIALQRHHEIYAIIDNPEELKNSSSDISGADVVIDFSLPEFAVSNILAFSEKNIPIVVGTTGWYNQLEEIKEYCLKNEKTILVGSNFSIGMNIVFEMNRKLAQLSAKHTEYDVIIEETHHLNKKDAPSGTAITLANDILAINSEKKSWINTKSEVPEELEIISFRKDNVFGIHSVIYSSEFDQIELKHTAFSRQGFALGAVIAAEWLIGKKGFFTMNDFLNL